MTCSAVTLSIATITAVVAVSCLAIAFGTDNWYEIRVNRNRTKDLIATNNKEHSADYEDDARYFDRDEGLFRVCFPNGKPKRVPTYMSPVQTECISVNYHIPEGQETKSFNQFQWTSLHMSRSTIGLFIVGFFFIFLSFFTGVTGCWKRSHSTIVATGLLQLMAALATAGAMGLWHGVQHYEYVKRNDRDSFSHWPEFLKQQGVTEFFYGWSYILAWIGVGMTMMTTILFLSAARCLRREKDVEQAKNMQYLMPVYPDKRQPYGYGYGYPGPYYYHGSQYGPYNY